MTDISKHSQDLQEFHEAWDDLGTTTFCSENDADRSGTILAASKFDKLLARYFRVYFRHDPIVDDLLKGTGVLSTFDAKIRMAFVPRILSSEEKAKLNYIRKIRNRFAHQTDASFLSEPMRQWTEALVADYRSRLDPSDHNQKILIGIFEGSDLPTRFRLECSILGSKLVERLELLISPTVNKKALTNIFELKR